MTTKRELEADSPPAILATDPVKRLDAIIRRHGGKPTTETTSRVVLPTPPGGEGAKGSSRSTVRSMAMSSRRDCRCPLARHVHGTPAGYSVCGCGCFECRVAYSKQGRDRRAGLREGAERTWPFVSNVGVQRRIQALHAIGWSGRELGDRLGVNHQRVHQLRVSDRPVMPATAERVAALYDALWDQRPPAGPSAYVCNLAARNGWQPPMAWDDDTIDDPTSRPSTDGRGTGELDEVAISEAVLGRLVQLTKHERAEAVRRLTDQGLSAREIGDRLHITSRTVTRRRSVA